VSLVASPVRAGASGEFSRKEPTVAKPYYTIEPEIPAVYHKENCPDGKQILEKNKRYGTDNRELCKECPKVTY
jgi:hypothetical protein